MIDKNSDKVQIIQEILRRTHKGRIITPRAEKAVSAWKSNVSTEYKKNECNLCGLILKSNYFIHGCLNCGSTDNQSIE